MTELHDMEFDCCDSLSCDAIPGAIIAMARHRNLGHASFLERTILVSDHEALVRRAIEAIWNRGDLDVADEVFAADYVNHHGLIADLVLGPEAIKISAALYHIAFPGLHVSVEEASTLEDTVVFRWTARSSPDRLGSGALASEPKSLTGITRSRFVAGKIIETWTEWDLIGVLGELGIPTE